jgi:hypothetical protein
MKYIFLLTLVISISASAQECKLIKETDPYTKETKLSTGFIFLKGGSVTVDADSKEIDILFSIEGADKCYDNNASAVIILEGSKTKTTLRNGGTMNCEGLFHFIFKNSASTTSILKKLTSQKITQVIFTGNNKKETIITLTPEQQQALLTLSNCLVNDAKALIK